MEGLERLASCEGFDWDAGNNEKNWNKHGVSTGECEEVFFNQPLVVAEDAGHSQREERFFALGHADGGRMLFVVFTIRGALVRVISARHEPQGKKGLRRPVSEQLPRFESEDEEREFWAERDSVDYVDWSRAKRVVLPNLKPSTRTISLRLPEMMLDELKLLANRRDVPYQSLIKVFLAERIDQELRGLLRRPAGGGLRMVRERPRPDDPAK